MQAAERRRVLAAAALLTAVAITQVSCAGIFNRPPEARIAIAEGSPYGAAPLTITFDISASFDPDGEIVLFVFDFGDGTEPLSGTDVSQPISHTYEQPGMYFARVTVTDDDGRGVASPRLLVAPR